MITFSNKLPLEYEFVIDDVELSLVIPAYNEENRLPKTVDNVLSYFSKREQNIKFELIIVNDGSKDNTWKKIEELMNKYNKIEISGVTYQENSGKGYAVTTGMKYARGKYILMLDADGAVPIKDYEKLRKEIKTEDNFEIIDNGVFVIGQRRQDEDSNKRHWYRNIPSIVNNFIVKSLIGIKDIEDTQRGFKLFSRRAAKNIIFNLHLVRWAFDVEMLYIAQKLDIPIHKVTVGYIDVPGSKLEVVSATISFFRDYFAMLTFYNTGFWNIHNQLEKIVHH